MLDVVVALRKTQAWFPRLLQILLSQEPGVVEPSPNCGCPLLNKQSASTNRLHVRSQDALQSRWNFKRDYWPHLVILENKTEADFDSAWRKWQALCDYRSLCSKFGSDPRIPIAKELQDGKQYTGHWIAIARQFRHLIYLLKDSQWESTHSSQEFSISNLHFHDTIAHEKH